MLSSRLQNVLCTHSFFIMGVAYFYYLLWQQLYAESFKLEKLTSEILNDLQLIVRSLSI